MISFLFGKRRAVRKVLRNCTAILLVLGLTFLPGCYNQPQNPSTGSASPSVSAGNTPAPSENESSAPTAVPSPEPSPITRYYSYDVIVYGGTPAGVMAATEATREGLKAAIIEPGDHLGGMISGGLGFSDVGNRTVIGGLAREFFIRTGIYYFLGGKQLELQYFV